MTGEFPRNDPAVTPEAPQRAAPSRKGMLVLYHGDGAGKETAALGVLFRAHGRGLPVGHLRFAHATSGSPSGDDLALERLGIPSHVIGAAGADGAKQLWRKAIRHMATVQEGVLVLERLLDAIAMGWLSATEIVDVITGKNSLLHVIVTGDIAPPELVEVADLVTDMRAIKARATDKPAIAGIDY